MYQAKPCPWCGPKGRRLVIECIDPMSKPKRYAVACHMCGAYGPEAKDEGKAVDAWNNRKMVDDYIVEADRHSN